jgi:UDP-glucose:(heptosyl)LPS alpha-1,3-glucosyltransferase
MDDKVALFIGHDFQRKGLRWAIEAIAATPDWNLMVAGLGKMREYIELVEERKLLKRVRFVGPTSEVARLLHAGDALLLPVFYDPAPLVVIEALTAGLPVISTDHLGSADIIREGRVGTIVDQPRNVAALAAALAATPTTGPDRAALAERAKAVAQGMPPEAFVDRICDLYAEFARRSGK